MDNYTITLPNDKAGTYKVVTLIIAIINLLGFLFTRVGISVEDSGYYFSGAGFFVILVPLTKYLFFKKDRLKTLWQILFGIII